MATYIREDQADIALTVDGKEFATFPHQSWATFAGGDLQAAGSKTRPGGMGKQVELGGPATRSDVTLTTQLSDILVGDHKYLEERVGKAGAKVTISYKDHEGNILPGAQFVVEGILKAAHLPGANYDSPTVGMYTVILACNEVSA